MYELDDDDNPNNNDKDDNNYKLSLNSLSATADNSSSNGVVKCPCCRLSPRRPVKRPPKGGNRAGLRGCPALEFLRTDKDRSEYSV